MSERSTSPIARLCRKLWSSSASDAVKAAIDERAAICIGIQAKIETEQRRRCQYLPQARVSYAKCATEWNDGKVDFHGSSHHEFVFARGRHNIALAAFSNDVMQYRSDLSHLDGERTSLEVAIDASIRAMRIMPPSPQDEKLSWPVCAHAERPISNADSKRFGRRERGVNVAMAPNRAFDFDLLAGMYPGEMQVLRAFVAVADSVTARTITYNGLCAAVSMAAGKAYMSFATLPAPLLQPDYVQEGIIRRECRYRVPIFAHVVATITQTSVAEWTETGRLRSSPLVMHGATLRIAPLVMFGATLRDNLEIDRVDALMRKQQFETMRYRAEADEERAMTLAGVTEGELRHLILAGVKEHRAKLEKEGTDAVDRWNARPWGQSQRKKRSTSMCDLTVRPEW